MELATGEFEFLVAATTRQSYF